MRAAAASVVQRVRDTGPCVRARQATEVFLDVTKLKIAPKSVLPIELQGPWESRRCVMVVVVVVMVAVAAAVGVCTHRCGVVSCGRARSLWRAVTAALATRPTVDWNLVEREKAKLEARSAHARRRRRRRARGVW